jgi:hypothetical protein
MIEEKWGENSIAILDEENLNPDGEPIILAIADADPRTLPSGLEYPRRTFKIEIRTGCPESVQKRCLEFIRERM